ncbi:hypothetical protein EMCRGX_G012665 [Ephydatia muelleri]
MWSPWDTCWESVLLWPLMWPDVLSQENYSTIVCTKELHSSLMVVSDSSDSSDSSEAVVTLLLSNQIVAFLNKNSSSVEYIHLSDLYTGAARDRGGSSGYGDMEGSEEEVVEDEVGRSEFEVGRSEVEVGRSEVEVGKSEVEVGRSEVEVGRSEVEVGRSEVEVGRGEVEVGRSEVEVGRSKVELGRGEVKVGRSEVEVGRSEVEVGRRDNGEGDFPNEGYVVKDSDNCFTVWCIGRTGCDWMMAQLRLQRRHNLFTLLLSLVRPSPDTVMLTLQLAADDMDNIVLALGQKKAILKQSKDLEDLVCGDDTESVPDKVPQKWLQFSYLVTSAQDPQSFVQFALFLLDHVKFITLSRELCGSSPSYVVLSSSLLSYVVPSSSSPSYGVPPILLTKLCGSLILLTQLCGSLILLT